MRADFVASQRCEEQIVVTWFQIGEAVGATDISGSGRNRGVGQGVIGCADVGGWCQIGKAVETGSIGGRCREQGIVDSQCGYEILVEDNWCYTGICIAMINRTIVLRAEIELLATRQC